MKIIKKMSLGNDFNLLNGWTNKKTIIRFIPFWYLVPIVSNTKKIFTWLNLQIILPHN